jgi:DNA-binding IscR family transcriptional regulator
VLLLRELRKAPVTKRAALAKAVGISSAMVQQVMLPLLKNGLVASNQTRDQGGYRLADPKHRATVREVVEALPRVADSGGDICDKIEQKVLDALNKLRVDDL